MRVVIVGLGDIGTELAGNLARGENIEMVLVDADEERCNELAADMDALVLHGDGTDPDILKKAQLAEAEALVATTGSDPINTVIAMLGNHFGVEKIIVKLNGVGLRSACQEIGVDRIIAPKISAAAAISSALHGFDRVDFSLVSRGGLRLVELEAKNVLGKRLADLNMPDGSLVIAVLRGDQVIMPRGNTKLEEADAMLTLVESEGVLKKARRLLDIEA